MDALFYTFDILYMSRLEKAEQAKWSILTPTAKPGVPVCLEAHQRRASRRRRSTMQPR